MSEKIPSRYVVHRSTRGDGRWEVHPKDSSHCSVTHPGWTGNSDCGCLGSSFPRGRWAWAVAEAHKRSSQERLAFRDRLQARGRAFATDRTNGGQP